ncbi:MAG TPA: hypothetical protein VFA03_13350 [Acetobacteraceae bacterium]|nr:hypothetical protein [Acetobacteraceae bacterium]
MDETDTAWILAHRILLAYLVRMVRQAVPAEAHPVAIDQTATMLHNSIAPILAQLPPDLAARIEAAAREEIDRVLTAPIRPVPKGST